MSVEMTIALVGDPTDATDLGIDAISAGDGTPYREFPTVTLRAEPNETLAYVLERAARHFSAFTPQGEPLLPMWISFFRPEHETAYRTWDESPVLTIVGEDGRASWGVGLLDPVVTVDALNRSAAAGVIEGDPTRPYFIVRSAMGNGVLPDWSDLVAGLLFVREVLSVVADGKDGVDVASWVRDRAGRLLRRFRRTPEVVEQHSPYWTSRHGSPYEIDGLIARRTWRAEDLARLLGTSSEDAEALLGGRGMTRDPETGLWSRGADSESGVLSEVYNFALTHEWTRLVEDGSVETMRTEITRSIRRSGGDAAAEIT